jgi:hypothetical protein
VQERLILASSGAEAFIWVIDQAKPPVQAARIEGRLVASGDRIFVYNPAGLYRLSPDLRSATLLYALPRAYTDLDDAVALPDGGLLLAHVDPADARLIAFNADGTLRWQRSYLPAMRSQSAAQARPRLATAGSRVYLLLQNNISTSSIADIFSVSSNDGALTLIFTGGTRNLAQEDAWVMAVDSDLVLVNYGGSVAALNVRSALKAVQPVDRRE